MYKKNRFKFLSMPLMVMALWIIALIFLIKDDQYTLFLKPEFGILLYISLLICCLFAASLLISKTNHHVQDSMVKGMITLLPILFILSAGDNTLGSYALSKRTLVAPQQSDPRPGPGTIKEKGTETINISIFSLTKEWEKYKGSKVSIEGLFHEPVGNDKDMAIVFRYFVTCCAADAMPVGVVIKREKIQQMKNNDWVRVTGVVREETMDGLSVIFMELEQIEKTTMPSKSAIYIYN